MIGKAACRGAATIVNAIATGKGAAFGITLEVDAQVELEDGAGDLDLLGSEEGQKLVSGCVRSIASRSGHKDVRGEVHIKSEIPISRGLKSSSAVSNVVGLATCKALGSDLHDMEIVLAGVEESIKAGVTITGAFDDASACFLGGVVATDNRNLIMLHRGVMDSDLEIIIHVPERRITKSSLKDVDFSSISKEVEHAFRLATSGEYMKAMELNSRAYSRVLDVSEDIATIARKKGAMAAGISGTGPATVIICGRAEMGDILAALERQEGQVLRAKVNNVPAREVFPRLL